MPAKKDITRLKDILRDKNRYLKTFVEIDKSIGRHPDLKKISDLLVRMAKADSYCIYLLNEKKDESALKNCSDHGLIQKKKIIMGQTGQGDWFDFQDGEYNKKRYKTFLSLDLKSGDEVIGSICLLHKKERRYSKEELSIIRSIINLIAIAMENALLHKEMQKKGMLIETLSLVSKTITSSRYLEEILHLLVTITAEMMNSKICSLMLLDEEKGELEIVATQSLSEEYRNKSNLKVGQSISGLAVSEKRPIAVLDVTKEKGYMYPALAKKEGLCSLLSVPMMIKDRVRGVINSYTSHKHIFTEDEIKILQAVANQAAVTIENTRLLERSVQVEEALATRKSIERAKGILMRERGITEDEAFRMIQKQSMDIRRSMREIAEAIILGSKIKSVDYSDIKWRKDAQA